MMEVEKIIRENRGTIVDVRTKEEFKGGHVEGSLNIPLHEIRDRIEELKTLPTPLVFCCASGNRSGQATYLLSSMGIECHNAGSWFDVNYLQSQKA